MIAAHDLSGTARKSPWRLRQVGLSLLVAASCGPVSHQHAEFYDNGQIRVLAAATDIHGKKEGPWMFFDRDGSIVPAHQSLGKLPGGSGFYEHGVRVRDLTPAESQAELARIQNYLRATGGR